MHPGAAVQVVWPVCMYEKKKNYVLGRKCQQVLPSLSGSCPRNPERAMVLPFLLKNLLSCLLERRSTLSNSQTRASKWCRPVKRSLQRPGRRRHTAIYLTDVQELCRGKLRWASRATLTAASGPGKMLGPLAWVGWGSGT